MGVRSGTASTWRRAGFAMVLVAVVGVVPIAGVPVGHVVADAAGDPVIAAAGDIACAPPATPTGTTCQQMATSNLLLGMNPAPAAVLTLGDNQYDAGALTDYQASYDPSWGRVKSVTHPSPGNHEYTTTGATGYYDYFGAAAGDRAQGWYSYDVGAWHVISLNAECGGIGGCGSGSPEETWLQADLAAHPNDCTLAYWHQPRWSTSTTESSNAAYDAFWRDLYAGGVDLVLNGHAHDYERYAPQTPIGTVDLAQGIREFVVGTGGKSHYVFGPSAVTDEVRDNTSFGVVALTLHAASYEWSFMNAAGSGFTDSGRAPCHGATVPVDATAPMPPSNLAATTPAAGEVDLTWSRGSDDSGLVGHRIYRDGALLATVGDTGSYADKVAAPGTAATYTVVAADAAGNTSAGVSLTVTSGGPAAGAVVTLHPTDDAYVDQTASTTNYGAATRVVADNSPVEDGLLRFDVQTGGCRIASARLSLTVGTTSNDNSPSGGTIRPTSAAWSERSVTWANAPPAGATALGSLTATTLGATTTVDISAGVGGDGPVAFRIPTTSSDGVRYFSKEGTSVLAQQPTLTVTCAASGDTTPPSTPTGLAVSSQTATTAVLSWTASSDDVAVAGYRVLGPSGVVGQTAGTSFTLTGLSPASGEDFAVEAVDSANNVSLPSQGVTVTTLPDTSAPSVPAKVTATPTSTQVAVSWTASTDDVAVVSYVVSRSGGSAGPTTTTVPATATSFTDTAVVSGVTYSYAVAAQDAAGNTSTYSGAVTATVPASDASPPTNVLLSATATGPTQASLSWSAQDNVGVTRYSLARNGSLVAGVTGTMTQYVDPGLTPGGTYVYVVTARDAAGNATASAPATVVLPAQTRFTFKPTDDTYVAQKSPTSKFGTSSYINADNSPVTQALVKFHVATGCASIASAALTLTVNADGSSDGGTVHPVATAWTEGTVTWNTAPTWAVGSAAVTVGRVANSGSYSVPLPSVFVARDGDVAFRISSGSPDGVRYYAKEGSVANAATLTVTCG